MIPSPEDNPLITLAGYRQDAERLTSGGTFVIHVDRRLPMGRRHVAALLAVMFDVQIPATCMTIDACVDVVRCDVHRRYGAATTSTITTVDGDPIGELACELGAIEIRRIGDTTLCLTLQIYADTDAHDVQSYVRAYVRAHRLLHIPAAMVAQYLSLVTAGHLEQAYAWFSTHGLLQYRDIPFTFTGLANDAWPACTVSVLNALVQTGPFLDQSHCIDDEGYVYLHIGGHARLSCAHSEDGTDAS